LKRPHGEHPGSHAAEIIGAYMKHLSIVLAVLLTAGCAGMHDRLGAHGVAGERYSDPVKNMDTMSNWGRGDPTRNPYFGG
jgi:hypothetical protein